jgi:hypothetical protein
MERTSNYSLRKPSQTDHYDVGHFNENADLIDNALQRHETGKEPIRTLATDAEADAGTQTAIRAWSPQRIRRAMRDGARTGILTGLASATGEFAASDTVLQGFGKAMGRINSINTQLGTINNNVAAAQTTATNANNNANGRQPALSSGTSSQVRRGDHSVQNIADLVPNRAISADSAPRVSPRAISNVRTWLSGAPQGLYIAAGANVANAPDSGSWQYIGLVSSNNNHQFIQAFSMTSGFANRITTCENRNGAWSGWHVVGDDALIIANAHPDPHYNGTAQIHRIGRVCTLHVDGYIDAGFYPDDMISICTLPVGFRPSQNYMWFAQSILHRFGGAVDSKIQNSRFYVEIRHRPPGMWEINGHVLYMTAD